MDCRPVCVRCARFVEPARGFHHDHQLVVATADVVVLLQHAQEADHIARRQQQHLALRIGKHLQCTRQRNKNKTAFIFVKLNFEPHNELTFVSLVAGGRQIVCGHTNEIKSTNVEKNRHARHNVPQTSVCNSVNIYTSYGAFAARP